MTTKYFDVKSGDNGEVFAECGAIIRGGGLVAFPTETVYGLGVSAFCPGSVKKVFAAKGRPSDNPLIVHVAFPQDAEDIAVTCPLYYRIAEAFMPGPITVILPKRDNIPFEVTGGLDSVGIRCPSHPAAHKLISVAGVPIAAPSANISGAPSPTKCSYVMRDMDGKIDAVIDGGDCDFGLESTVVSVKGDSAVILRPGAVTREDLLLVCDSVSVSPAVKDPSAAGDRPESPGMKYKHYSPKAHFVLLDGDRREFIKFVSSVRDGKVGVICPKELDGEFDCRIKRYLYGDTDELCHRLFAFFRQADDDGVTELFASLPDDNGRGLALYNRMIRAAGCKVIKAADPIKINEQNEN